MPETEVVDPNEGEPNHLVLRRPDAPVNLNELAALKGEALEIIEARVQILATVRKAALRATSPTDWLLFKAPDDQGGQVVGYLQDCGCDRVRDLFGINIFNVSTPEKISTNDPKVFHFIIYGSGRCNLTRQVIENIVGGRASTDDFCRDKSGADLELAVRKATRANLDGNIVRELASLAGVPIEELADAWAGTWKKTEQCRRGRGFGSKSERLGGTSTRGGAADVEPPVCPHCGAKGVYRQAKGEPGTRGYRAPFYGCPNYEKHSDKKFIVDAAKWEAEQLAKKTTAAAPATAQNGAATKPLSANDVFGKGDREPGSDD